MFHGRYTEPSAIAPSPLLRQRFGMRCAGDHITAIAGGIQAALKTELFRRSYGNANCRPQQH